MSENEDDKRPARAHGLRCDARPVELTEAERAELDVAGMFPTQFGWEHPEKWEKSTARSIGAKVGRIVASRVARIVAQGYVPVTKVAAREAAARREALLEAEERVSKAEDELRRVKAASLYADGHMQVIVDMDRRYDRLRAHAEQTEQELDKARAQVEEYAAIKAHLAASIRSAEKAEAKLARVEALADCPPGDCEGHPCIWPEDLRAALAEPERDEEGGR